MAYLGLALFLAALLLLDGVVLGANASQSVGFVRRLGGPSFRVVFPVLLACTVIYAAGFAIFCASTSNLPLVQ